MWADLKQYSNWYIMYQFKSEWSSCIIWKCPKYIGIIVFANQIDYFIDYILRDQLVKHLTNTLI